MDWACILAYITGTVDQELLLRNEYLATERGRDRAPYVAARSADIGAAAFSASSRLFDLKSEATTRISARLFADVMCVCYAIKTDEVRYTHLPAGVTNASPR
jgi:hypothetical protein